MELGCVTLPLWMCSPPRNSPNLVLLGFYGASSHGRDQLLIPFFSPSPFSREGGGAEESKLLITAGFSR